MAVAESYVGFGSEGSRPVVRPSRLVAALSWTIVALAAVAAGLGLLWNVAEGPATFTTVRGETVTQYARGIYRFDSLFAGAGHKGTDAVTLFIGLPALIGATAAYGRASARGALLLLGALTWFLYAYASFALGVAAYNEAFLLYVALFAASLFALAVTLRSLDAPGLAAALAARAPRRGLAMFMIVSGIITFLVWISIPIEGMIRGAPPTGLSGYATLFTVALDIAIIVPLAVLAGVMLLRRDPIGYLLAVPLLVLEALLAPMIVAQTISQLLAGITFTPAEIAGPIAGFVIIALAAAWFLTNVLRSVPPAAPTGPSAPASRAPA